MVRNKDEIDYGRKLLYAMVMRFPLYGGERRRRSGRPNPYTLCHRFFSSSILSARGEVCDEIHRLSPTRVMFSPSVPTHVPLLLFSSVTITNAVGEKSLTTLNAMRTQLEVQCAVMFAVMMI